MERMKHTGDYELDKINMLEQECSDLEEENKSLKDKIEHLEFDIEAWKKLKAVWEKKEQKLQIEIGGLMGERDGLQMVAERLQDELKDLEHNWDIEKRKADRKAIENTELRKKNKELLLYINDLEDELYAWKQLYKKQKEELSKYKKSYQHSMGFSDFGGYDE